MMRKKSHIRFWAIMMIVLAIIGAMTGTMVAKYVYRQQLKGRVTFTAELAESVQLLEHEAVRQSDGGYTLNTDPTDANEYHLLPGLDVPKDPYVRVIGKTPIESYLYIEVVELNNSAITYEIDEDNEQENKIGNWKKMNIENRSIYVYTGGTGAAKVLTTNFPDTPIYLLEGGKDAVVTVSDKLLSSGLDPKGEALTFHAYLYEIGKTDGTAWDENETFSKNVSAT